MPGILGGTAVGREFQQMAESMLHEPWHGKTLIENGDYGGGLVHLNGKDEASDLTWNDSCIGVIHGVFVGDTVDTEDPGTFFQRLLEGPAQTLAGVDGLFSLAVIDPSADRLVLATDKVGSRPIYYTTASEMAFASELKALVTRIDDPQLDLHGINDVLLLGAPLGENTLLDSVSELRPGSVLVYDQGDVSIERYWCPDFGYSDEVEGYVERLLTAYRGSIHDVAETMRGRPGMWLSGGLDSRLIAAVLSEELESVYTMTYDIPGEGEMGNAKQVADLLGLENEQIKLGTPAEFAEHLDSCIDLVDGMIPWTYLINATFNLTQLSDRADVVIEGAPHDTYLGHDVWDIDARNIRRSSLTDAWVERHARTEPSVVDRLLKGRVEDTFGTIRREMKLSDAGDPESVFRDVGWQSVAYTHLRSSNVPRSQVGTRIPVVSTTLLNTLAQRPRRYNRKSVPFVPMRVPRSATRLKYEITREVGGGIETIPYQLTRLPPSYPQWLHTAGMAVTELAKRIRSPARYAEWYRTDETFQQVLDGLLDSATRRPHFDADTIEELRTTHLNGDANNIFILAGISSVEQWTRTYLD